MTQPQSATREPAQRSLRLGLVGYGRMGRAVHTAAEGRGHRVTVIVDPHAPGATAPALTPDLAGQVDAVIDFSAPATAQDHLLWYGRSGIPAVVGTTGWYEHLPTIQAELAGQPAAIIWSGNFSIGVRLFTRLVAQAAALFAPFADYDALLHEFHHAGKADSPSGTALELAQAVQGEWQRQPELHTGRLDRQRRPEELHLSSTRGGSIPGTHTVIFDSPADTVELTHRARSREGFAAGAVQAAEWIAAGRQGFFTLDELLDDVFAAQPGSGQAVSAQAGPQPKHKPSPDTAARKR
ncbi:4-hydroxy-tetrahydrodipicolinate reductase [Deinococcus piscis]|uniref:4-hydroxy-tetrahydrodipicolinate reductase n=1 Tax=Deinococcus piscis TaxID=394230 RepID=A0ABQ3K3L8_9DEIO|nr:4-hydroxy-tetrahydrodipicolinate reductase [Deinococcus piscis]GHF96213.1 4-hydroxy-tetrahydrodipicolinate reductase [Deinococcus piscis]